MVETRADMLLQLEGHHAKGDRHTARGNPRHVGLDGRVLDSDTARRSEDPVHPARDDVADAGQGLPRAELRERSFKLCRSLQRMPGRVFHRRLGLLEGVCCPAVYRHCCAYSKRQYPHLFLDMFLTHNT